MEEMEELIEIDLPAAVEIDYSMHTSSENSSPPSPVPETGPTSIETVQSPTFRRRVFTDSLTSAAYITQENLEVPNTSSKQVLETKSEETKSSELNNSKKEEDDGQSCSICFEQWTNSGEHRLSSLKCGHVFGKSCIETWLSGTGGSRCPQCNAKASKKDIRVLFAKSLKVIDTSERDRLQMELDKLKGSKKQLDRDHAQVLLKCELQTQLVKTLQEELRILKASISNADTLPILSHSSENSKVYKLVFYKSFDISKENACRVMAYSEWLNMLVVSVQSQVAMFPGFGIKKINLFDMKLHRYVPLHQKQIRDLCFNRVKHDILLSVSIDKTIKITNVSTNAIVHQYTANAGLWSCIWKGDSSTEFFVGTANGTVLFYDTACPSDLLQTYTVLGSGPAVSLNYIVRCDTAPDGILVTRLNKVCFLEVTLPDTAHELTMDGLYVGSSYDQQSGHILVSCRPSQKFPHARHILSTLNKMATTENVDDVHYNIVDREVHAFSGSSIMKAMARSSIVFSCFSKTWILICEESAMCAKLYDASQVSLKQRLDVNANIIDALLVRVEECHYIALLSEKHVKLYKWVEQL